MAKRYKITKITTTEVTEVIEPYWNLEYAWICNMLWIRNTAVCTAVCTAEWRQVDTSIVHRASCLLQSGVASKPLWWSLTWRRNLVAVHPTPLTRCCASRTHTTKPKPVW
jgi:hypothetical protein